MNYRVTYYIQIAGQITRHSNTVHSLDHAKDLASDYQTLYHAWGPVTIWHRGRVLFDSAQISLLDLSTLTD